MINFATKNRRSKRLLVILITKFCLTKHQTGLARYQNSSNTIPKGPITMNRAQFRSKSIWISHQKFPNTTDFFECYWVDFLEQDWSDRKKKIRFEQN